MKSYRIIFKTIQNHILSYIHNIQSYKTVETLRKSIYNHTTLVKSYRYHVKSYSNYMISLIKPCKNVVTQFTIIRKHHKSQTNTIQPYRTYIQTHTETIWNHRDTKYNSTTTINNHTESVENHTKIITPNSKQPHDFV